jgi:ribosomal protein S18 acetylase RimI-like enzyme
VRVLVRAARPEDAEQLARLWVEVGRELTELDRQRFRVPDRDGVVEFTEADLARSSATDVLSVVAEIDGRIAGSVEASLLAPVASARHQVMSELGETRVFVNYLGVDPEFRRRGVGTRLMAAVEQWGREHGATSIALDTYVNSPLSVPFYEALGYEPGSIRFEKRLGS